LIQLLVAEKLKPVVGPNRLDRRAFDRHVAVFLFVSILDRILLPALIEFAVSRLAASLLDIVPVRIPTAGKRNNLCRDFAVFKDVLFRDPNRLGDAVRLDFANPGSDLV
jgi:hypothetical protein